MKRKIMATILVVIMAVSLAACGSGGKDSGEKKENKSTASEDKKQTEPKADSEDETKKDDTKTDAENETEKKAETVTGPYETELEPGDYYIGLHIPEGVYNVQVVSGLGNIMTKSGIVSAMGSGTGVEYADTYENASLKNGDILHLTQSLKVKITTQEATFSTMESYENPATEEKELGAGDYVIGQDIPAGAYDISIVGGTLVTVSLSDYSFSGMFSDDPTLSESSGSLYKNLELSEGLTLKVANGTVKLTPMPNLTPLTP